MLAIQRRFRSPLPHTKWNVLLVCFSLQLTSMFEINQAARRLLTPPAAIARTRVQETIVRQETTVRRPSCELPNSLKT